MKKFNKFLEDFENYNLKGHSSLIYGGGYGDPTEGDEKKKKTPPPPPPSGPLGPVIIK